MVKLSLCLIEHIDMNAYGVDGGKWLASRPGHFTPSEITPGTHWMGARGSVVG
jgi:hypothetical protein